MKINISKTIFSAISTFKKNFAILFPVAVCYQTLQFLFKGNFWFLTLPLDIFIGFGVILALPVYLADGYHWKEALSKALKNSVNLFFGSWACILLILSGPGYLIKNKWFQKHKKATFVLCGLIWLLGITCGITTSLLYFWVFTMVVFGSSLFLTLPVYLLENLSFTQSWKESDSLLQGNGSRMFATFFTLWAITLFPTAVLRLFTSLFPLAQIMSGVVSMLLANLFLLALTDVYRALRGDTVFAEVILEVS